MSKGNEDQMKDEDARVMSNEGEHSITAENKVATSAEANTDSPTEPSTYTPTPKELAMLREHGARRTAKRTPRLTLTSDNQKVYLSNSHPNPDYGDAWLERAIGIADNELFSGLIAQLGAATTQGGKPSELALNFAFSVIKGIDPRDPTEALLGSQMAIVHSAAMAAAQRFQNASSPAEQEVAERMLNRLTRTFAGQMEALKRYRSGSSQTVTVQNVSVSDGGQAIVGNVTQSAGPNTTETSATTAAPASPAAVPSVPVRDNDKPAPTGKKGSSE